MNKPSMPMTAAQKAERLRVAAIDGKAARAEYDAAAEHQDEKMARLKALRMERDRIEAENAPPVAKPRRAAPVKRLRRNIPLG